MYTASRYLGLHSLDQVVALTKILYQDSEHQYAGGTRRDRDKAVNIENKGPDLGIATKASSKHRNRPGRWAPADNRRHNTHNTRSWQYGTRISGTPFGWAIPTVVRI